MQTSKKSERVSKLEQERFRDNEDFINQNNPQMVPLDSTKIK